MSRRYHFCNTDFVINDNNMLRAGNRVFYFNDFAFCIVKNVLSELSEVYKGSDFGWLVPDFVLSALMERMSSIKDKVNEEYDVDDIILIYKDCVKIFSSMYDNKVISHDFYSISDKIFAPVHVDFALTYRCNNDCRHCYHGGSSNFKTSPEMTMEDLDKTLDKLNNAGIFEINFTGGEPLLRLKELEYLIEKYSSCFRTQVATNGRLLNSDVCNSLRDKGVANIQISIQHVDAFENDAMCGAKGAWNDTIKGISNAVDSGVGVTTLTTLQSENKQSIDELVVLLSKMGVKKIGVNSLFYSDKSRNDSSRLTKQELSIILNRINAIAEDNGSSIHFIFPVCYRLLDPNIVKGFRRCTVGVNTLAIEPDGNVIPCSCWFGDSCGNIISDDWSKIWRSDVVLKIRNREPVGECVRCEWIDQCNGACPLEHSSCGGYC